MPVAGSRQGTLYMKALTGVAGFIDRPPNG
jgi:hypothetical protein